MKYLAVFNRDNAPVQVDEDGRVAYPQEFSCVPNTEYVARALADERLVDVYDTITKKWSIPEVWAVKEETDRRNQPGEAHPRKPRTINVTASAGE